ncbi:MAG: hypothetical protein ACD_79C00435G0002 [uncultured bacterium]|nr:MAG: hypothetical protein ACD_79C00435G0002 [uncultured bacterium]
MRKILIPTKLDKIAKEILEEKGYKVVYDATTPYIDVVKNNPDADAIIVRSEKVTAQIIDMLPNLKTIVRAGAGYDNIDTKYARSKKIDVMNTPGANANGVAEEAVGMMVAVSRFFIDGDVTTRKGLWEKNNYTGTELANKTVGIFGLGAIGQLVRKRLLGFDVKVLGFDPFISSDKAKELGIEMVSLEEMFKRSDYISLHAPETPETIGIVNEKLLMLMKNGAAIINCARSSLINEADLRKIKPIKNLKFANDVYEKDAAGEKSIKDIADIMLPHVGASTKESNFNAAKRSAEEIFDLWEKGITRYIVNGRIPDALDEKYQELCHIMTKLARAWLGNKPVRQIESSFYGELKNFSEWMITPIVSGLDSSFDILSDAAEALNFLKEKGIDYTVRKADDSKKYGESITIDMFSGQDNLERISVRGTVTEDSLMISRIADFNKLYFDPKGHNLFFTYTDRPAVLGKITSVLGKANINIHDIRAPHNETRDKSLAIVKIDKPVSEAVVKEISNEIKAIVGFYQDI